MRCPRNKRAYCPSTALTGIGDIPSSLQGPEYPALHWQSVWAVLLSEAVVIMTLMARGEVEAIRRGAAVDMAVELSALSGEERTALLTHLVEQRAYAALSVRRRRHPPSHCACLLLGAVSSCCVC